MNMTELTYQAYMLLLVITFQGLSNIQFPRNSGFVPSLPLISYVILAHVTASLLSVYNNALQLHITQREEHAKGNFEMPSQSQSLCMGLIILSTRIRE